MTSPTTRDRIEPHKKLLLSLVTLGLDVLAILRALNPEGPIPALGTPEYVGAAVIFGLLTVFLLVGWSRQFWPSVKFAALYDLIAASREDIGTMSLKMNPDHATTVSITDVEHLHVVTHRMDELGADLHRLGIDLPSVQADQDSVRRLHRYFRDLAVLSRDGDIRGARELRLADEEQS